MTTQEDIRGNLLRWIEDLETTDAKQGTGLLRSHLDEFCCLGRACVVLKVPVVREPEPGEPFSYQVSPLFGSETSLAEDLWEALGITTKDEDTLMGMNDGIDDWKDNPQTFRQVAVWLRENVLPRYSGKAAVEGTP